jgi:hypothetical protein
MALRVGGPDSAPGPSTTQCLPIGEKRIRVKEVSPKVGPERSQGEYRVTFDAAARCDWIPPAPAEDAGP